jgi:nicotinate-nucleotide adenylyltransferase
VTRRVGLFGGTFDPPHRGHVAAAETARVALGLDEVKFVVANDPWQKSGSRTVSPASIRLEMVRALVGGITGMSVDDCEIARGGPSYTVETLEHHRASEPDTSFFVILGADAARGVSTWNRFEDVVSLSTLVVVNRPTDRSERPVGVPAERCIFVSMKPVDVSSSVIRARVASGEPVIDMTGPEVAGMIERHGLYGAGR